MPWELLSLRAPWPVSWAAPALSPNPGGNQSSQRRSVLPRPLAELSRAGHGPPGSGNDAKIRGDSLFPPFAPASSLPISGRLAPWGLHGPRWTEMRC